MFVVLLQTIIIHRNLRNERRLLFCVSFIFLSLIGGFTFFDLLLFFLLCLPTCLPVCLFNSSGCCVCWLARTLSYLPLVGPGAKRFIKFRASTARLLFFCGANLCWEDTQTRGVDQEAKEATNVRGTRHDPRELTK